MSDSNQTGVQALAYRSGEQHMTWGFPPGVSLVDLVPEDMKALTHPHWNKFPPVNPMWHYLLVSNQLFMMFLLKV